MELDSDKILEKAFMDACREGIHKKMTESYSNPLSKLIDASIDKFEGKFRALFEKAIATCLDDAQFTSDIASAIRSALAKQLVQKFGGELEKQINALKSDPTTRARIIIALDDIVKSKTA